MKLKDYLQQLEEQKEKKIEKEDLENLLHWISIYQHERLIHLIVTFMTAMATILFLLGSLVLESLLLLLLFGITLCLLVPYFFYYYHLENGVQKLYTYYDWYQKKL